MKPVKWGVLSTARIGDEFVIPAMVAAHGAEPLAIASRDKARGAALAAKFGIPRAYGSYEELLADPDVEAVYNPLPNHLHVPMTLAATAAGKHVLCEKPVAMNSAEAARLRAAPKGVTIEEAFMVRHNPQWIAIRRLVDDGAIGAPRAFQMVFSYRLLDPDNVRNKADIGGGAMMDIGCYPIALSRFVFRADPVQAIAAFDRDPTFGTDRFVDALARFPGGRTLSFVLATQGARHQRVTILGETGVIEVEIPVNAPADKPGRFTLYRAGEAPKVHEMPLVDQYRREIEDFSASLRGGPPLEHGVEDAIANMKAIDAFFRSEKSGRWEDVG
ncbi:MAG: Gfo/Idh/MocA family oxidoreductase [Hyphomicrobiales bacterium]|nr:Gfo/Idh/MocA family oxidoreductase [Hyphomicrobiales bacterium]MDE2016702.1 Gfo/Idh/MocA family oxidoreductase [Hyphomicrobiales bacterium]